MFEEEIDRFLEGVAAQPRTSLHHMLEGYRLCARSEGKRPATIALVEAAVRYLEQFLRDSGLSIDIGEIGVHRLRAFTVHLEGRQRFARHRFTQPQPGQLSGHTVNAYLRALRSLWSWAQDEGLIEVNPFTSLRIPKPPHKVIPTFREEQLERLLAGVDTRSPTGQRDYTMMLILLDTGIRCGELVGLRMREVNLEGRSFKVWGKGSRERVVPFGRAAQSALWKYLTLHRPQPLLPRHEQVFLTAEGRPLTNRRLQALVAGYGRRAQITGVRASPHTFRHTFAVMFLRNGGDVFSLQRILGHATLDVVRTYVNLAQSDLEQAHRRHSPADNLDFTARGARRRTGKPGPGMPPANPAPPPHRPRC